MPYDFSRYVPMWMIHVALDFFHLVDDDKWQPQWGLPKDAEIRARAEGRWELSCMLGDRWWWNRIIESAKADFTHRNPHNAMQAVFVYPEKRLLALALWESATYGVESRDHHRKVEPSQDWEQSPSPGWRPAWPNVRLKKRRARELVLGVNSFDHITDREDSISTLFDARTAK